MKHFKVVVMMTLAILMAASWIHARPISYLPGMVLGKGFDSLSGTVKGNCIKFEVHKEPSRDAIDSAQWSWDQVSSNSDVMQLLEVDAGASIDLGLFSASAEMSLLSKNELSNFSVNTLGSVNVDLRWETVQSPSLKTKYETLLQDPIGFQQECGNHYIMGVMYGGTFYSLITIETSSQKDREEMSAKMQASYGPFSAKGSVDSETLKTLQKRNASIKGYGSGLGTNSIPLDPATMKTRFVNFPNEVSRVGGTPIKVILAEYPNIANFGDRNLNDLARERWDWVSVKREVEFVLANPSQFYMTLVTWKPALNKLHAVAEKALKKIDLAVRKCTEAKKECILPKTMRRPNDIRAQLPPRFQGDCGVKEFDLQYVSQDVFPLTRQCGGDTEMKGNKNPANIKIISVLWPMEGGTYVDMRTYVKMRENGGDYTCFQEAGNHITIKQVSLEYPGCYLSSEKIRVASPYAGNLKASSTTKTKSELKRGELDKYTGGSGLVKSAKCLSDTWGKDKGKIGCREIKFRNAVVTLSNDEEKMGPNDLKKSASTSWRNKKRISWNIQRKYYDKMITVNKMLESKRKVTGAYIPAMASSFRHGMGRSVIPRDRVGLARSVVPRFQVGTTIHAQPPTYPTSP